jgi:hypothetical protein
MEVEVGKEVTDAIASSFADQASWFGILALARVALLRPITLQRIVKQSQYYWIVSREDYMTRTEPS